MDITFSLSEIKKAAAEIWQSNSQLKVWAFHGEMGSGKTTFIHAMCEVLGVASGIGSPTYSIINQYKSALVGTIYHMDLYRLQGELEAMQAGVEDVLYSGNLCLVEWPEKAAGLLPEDCLHMHLILKDETTRTISYML